MPVSSRQQGTGSFLFGLGTGEYALDTAVRLPKSIGTAPEYAAQPFVIAADKEELSVFNDMGEVIIGSVAHISEIYGGGPLLPAPSTILQKAAYSFIFLAGWTTRLVKRLSRME